MFIKIFSLTFFLFFYSRRILAVTDKVVCYFLYYESWTPETQFKIEDINVDICTHVNFAFLRLNDDGTFRFDGGANDSGLVKFGSLKTKNPNVKLLITVGGWTEDSIAFSHVAADDHKRVTMATNVVHFMQKYNLDGVNIDWEYPGKHGGNPTDKKNVVDLVSVIRKTLDQNGGGLVTLAAYRIPNSDSYDVNSLSKLVLDGINIMSFDYHGKKEDTKTGVNSPLYSSLNDTEWEKINANCDASVNSWLNSGADPSKLILGLPFYGHVFQLVDPEHHSTGSPANGADENYTSYYKICNLTSGWTEDWNEEQEVPYKYSQTEWFSYDNPKSIGLKVVVVLVILCVVFLTLFW